MTRNTEIFKMLYIQGKAKYFKAYLTDPKQLTRKIIIKKRD